jgi:hypothetical protein
VSDVKIDQGDGFAGLYSLGKRTMARNCMICGREGATHATPSGQAVHLSCGKEKWQKELDKAKLSRKRRRS